MSKSLSNKQQVFKSINIEDIYYKHLPIPVKFKDNQYIIYTSKINNFFFINTNSLCFENYRIDKWKRQTDTNIQIIQNDKKYSPMKSVYSDKNFGSWIIKDLISDFGNWLGVKNTEINKNNNLIGFGKFLQENIDKLYNEYDYENDLYFLQYNNKFIRRNKENNYICLTDILNMYNKDIRNYKKTKEYKNNKDEFDKYFISNTQTTDYFGIRVSYIHPKIINPVINWIFKNLDLDNEKDDILNFINMIEIETETESEEEIEEEDQSDIEEEQESEINENNSTCLNTDISKCHNVSEIFKNYSLILSDGTIFDIPVRKDGYINVTKLCEAAGKRIDNWKANKESKELLHAFTLIPENLGITIFDNIRGNFSDGRTQGTFAHPDIAISIAMWCNPYFHLQVSRWIRELLVTGKVEVGKEKSNQELQQLFESQFIEMKNNYKELLDKNQEEYRNSIQYIKSFNQSKENYKESIKENMLAIIQSYIDEFNYEREENNYDDKNVLYMAYIRKDNDKYVFKFGQSSDFNSRELSNKRSYDNFKILCVSECRNSITCERQFREYVKNKDKLYDQKNHKELFYVLNNNELIEMKYTMKRICKDSLKNQNNTYTQNYETNNINIENINRLKNEEKILDFNNKILDLFAEGKLTSQQLEMFIKK